MMKNIARYFMMLALPLLSIASMQAQVMPEAVSWATSHSNTEDGIVTLSFTAKLASGWHIYGTDFPDGGPTKTALVLDGSRGVALLGGLKALSATTEVYDPFFEMDLTWHAGEVTFEQKAQITDAEGFVLAGDLEFMLCDDTSCTPPDRLPFKLTVADLTTPLTTLAALPEGVVAEESDTTEASVAGESTKLFAGDIWAPVIDELNAYDGGVSSTAKSSLWAIFALGFLGGLVALMTPCVWPMIPMTVSFFLSRSKSRKGAIRDAIIYGVAIIVIYLVLGLLITGIFGAGALNNLATSGVFNLIFFLLLVVFAISFFGAFEMTLPSSWTNKMDAKSNSSSGLISIFFMAATLVLISFSCTGPIIGTLLVEAAVSGSLLGPAVGMGGFALALAIPFALLAIFPNLLQSMPKSGGWMTSVKVTLGFLMLAMSLKFLTTADAAFGWGILGREAFISIWIVIAILLGVYLLGKLKLPHDSDLPHVGITRLFLAILTFAFAIYLLPGLWGAPLKAVSGFLPPLSTQEFNLYETDKHTEYTDYEVGMNIARSEGKPVFVDFTGNGCSNCKEMKATVWTDERVKEIVSKEFILITLTVDERTKLPEYLKVIENGKERTLKTIGDKWAYFQRTKFGTTSQPFYVLLDPDGKPLAPSYGHDKDVEKFVEWLNSGVTEFKNRR